MPKVINEDARSRRSHRYLPPVPKLTSNRPYTRSASPSPVPYTPLNIRKASDKPLLPESSAEPPSNITYSLELPTSSSKNPLQFPKQIHTFPTTSTPTSMDHQDFPAIVLSPMANIPSLYPHSNSKTIECSPAALLDHPVLLSPLQIPSASQPQPSPLEVPNSPMVQDFNFSYPLPQNTTTTSTPICPATSVPQFYDHNLLESHKNCSTYKSIALYHLQASPFVETSRLPSATLAAHGGWQQVFNELAHLSREFLGGCIYCVASNSSNEDDIHSSLYLCNGPMGRPRNHYYQCFRRALHAPDGVCFSCWTPVSASAFLHAPVPPGAKVRSFCTGRQGYEDIFRALPYIIWRIDEYRHATFAYLGAPHLADVFKSTVDYTRWLTQLSTPSNTCLINLHYLVFAWLKLRKLGQLPTHRLEFNSPLDESLNDPLCTINPYTQIETTAEFVGGSSQAFPLTGDHDKGPSPLQHTSTAYMTPFLPSTLYPPDDIMLDLQPLENLPNTPIPNLESQLDALTDDLAGLKTSNRNETLIPLELEENEGCISEEEEQEAADIQVLDDNHGSTEVTIPEEEQLSLAEIDDLVFHYHPISETPELEAQSFLRNWHIIVDSTFHQTICLQCEKPVIWAHVLAHVSHHRNQNYSALRAIGDVAPVPSKDDFLSRLISLGADKPKPWPTQPIAPIDGLNHTPAARCNFPLCSFITHGKTEKLTRENIRRHTKDKHPMTLPSFTNILTHHLKGFRGSSAVQYVEIIPPKTLYDSNHSLQALIRHCATRGLGATPDSFKSDSQLKANAMNVIYSQLNWYKIIEDVSFPLVFQSASTPNMTSPVYESVIWSVGPQYYAAVVEELDTLSVLTRRWLRSPNKNSELKQIPFRRPQENGTLNKDANFLTKFVLFLIRNIDQPIPNFPIIVHPHTLDLLAKLKEASSVNLVSIPTLIPLFHEAVWSFVSHPSQAFLENDLMCPFIRYMVASSLLNETGTFIPIRLVPPHLSEIQWCWRGSGAYEIIQKKALYDNDTLRTYEALIAPFLLDDRQTPFTVMRQHMKLISSIVFSQDTIPRFTWDAHFSVVSMDGYPLKWVDIINGFKSSLSDLEAHIDIVFRGCRYEHILEYIDSRLEADSSSSENWFRDSRDQTQHGYSLVKEKLNHLEQYRPILLAHMIEDSRLFVTVDGKPHAKQGALLEWFAHLQNVIDTLYVLVAFTSPGSARGTEMEALQYCNDHRHPKNLHFLNGILCIEMLYTKTQSLQGTAKTLLRMPAHQVSRYLILILTTVHYAAAHVSEFVNIPVENANNYLTHIFVKYGKPMTSDDFSKAIANMTAKKLGLPLHLRAFRQLDKAMFTTKCNLSMNEPDEQSKEIKAMHSFHGHSADTAEHHYGQLTNNSTNKISSDRVAFYQRVGMAWQTEIQFPHPHFKKYVLQTLTEPPSSYPFTRRAFDDFCQQQSNAHDKVLKVLDDQTAELKESFTSIVSSGFYQIASLIKGPGQIVSSKSPIFVHPNLRSTVMSSLYADGDILWNSVAQAESVASVLSNDHIFSILPTGGGKSLQFFAAPVLMPSRLFVVILPLVSLMDDMERRLQTMPYKGGVWSPGTLINPMDIQLLLVPAHRAGTHEFYHYLKLPAIHERLERIFIDEVHHIRTDATFRECFARLRYLTALGKKFSFLSATVPPTDLPFILNALDITDTSLVREIRSYTGRPNHAYSHQKVEADNLIDVVIKYVQSLPPLAEDERGLIYVTSIYGACVPLGEALGFKSYFAALSDPIKKDIQNKWHRGKALEDRWLVCTNAYSEGIDFGGVRHVVNVEPFGMTDLKQQGGRAGRDGKRSQVHTIWTRLPWFDPTSDDIQRKQELSQYYQEPLCLRFAEASMDGKAHCCAALNGELCMNCEKAGCILSKPCGA
ncbi:hypothetical protein F5879DRAFT_991007 [Lentinula edodes]|nr:hypothetical protein F5879DRAFT_991007 [Lentinula edodes]